MIKVVHPGSGIRCLFDPWIRDTGWRIRIRDEQPRSYFRELRYHFLGLKYLNSLMRIWDPGWKEFGSGIRDGKNRVRDPGWKKSGPGSGMERIGSGIRDKHPEFATLTVGVIVLKDKILK
jgi:hypothetical protein